VDVEREIRHLQISSRRAVTDLLAGEYNSAFKGAGVDFEEVRMYQPGDDVRSIDWNVTARTGDVHVRRYAEERELSVFFLIDLSGSGRFGSLRQSKNDAVARVTSLLATAATCNHDNVGLILFSDHVERVIRPGKGRLHVRRILRELMTFQPKGTGTNIAAALHTFMEIMPRRCVVFLLSDFQDDGFEDELRLCAHRHDLIAVDVTDRRELELPSIGLVQLADPETGSVHLVDTSNRQLREVYRNIAAGYHRTIAQICHDLDIDLFRICTERDYLHDLIVFFRLRKRRRVDAKV
jgi:uncharacterized protein (DUF58 family)